MNNHPPSIALRRRDEILRLVREVPVRSQEELQRLLAGRGIVATQPTLSRDVRELGLAKTPRGYVAPGEVAHDSPARAAQRLDRVLAESVVSVVQAGSLVVVKTPPAGAHPVAHVIDEASIAGVAGTIAGDDTVFLAARDSTTAAAVAARLSAPLQPAPARRRRA